MPYNAALHPGMLMSARALLNRQPDPSIDEVKEALAEITVAVPVIFQSSMLLCLLLRGRERS